MSSFSVDLCTMVGVCVVLAVLFTLLSIEERE